MVRLRPWHLPSTQRLQSGLVLISLVLYLMVFLYWSSPTMSYEDVIDANREGLRSAEETRNERLRKRQEAAENGEEDRKSSPAQFWRIFAMYWILRTLLQTRSSQVNQRRGRFLQPQQESANEVPQDGLTQREINVLPSQDFNPNEDAHNNTCSICLEAFQEGDIIRKLPRCQHNFHVECIDSWLVRKAECPVCKQPVVIEQV